MAESRIFRNLLSAMKHVGISSGSSLPRLRAVLQTDRQTDKTTTVTLVHARRGLIRERERGRDEGGVVKL